MTITISWERRLRTYSELIFCSDSRLCGNGNVDVCQKIFPLPREDSAIGFCGSTLIAFPLIHQFLNYTKNHKQNLDRALDGSELPTRFEKLANKFVSSYMDAIELEADLKDTSFIIGSFSVQLGRPKVSQIRYDSGARCYVVSKQKLRKKPCSEVAKAGRFCMVGDLRHQYMSELGELLDIDSAESFDMEPLTALCNMLSNPAYTDRHREHRGVIGGAPQILKVYPFLRSVEFGAHWPSRPKGRLYLSGREVFDYEKLSIPQIDCESLEVFYPLQAIPTADHFSEI